MINATVTIDIPSDRICNWYQKCTSIVNKIGSEDGCSWTCALDVANIYGPSACVPRNMPDSAWGSLGCTWELPDTCTGSIAGYTSYSDKSESVFFQPVINIPAVLFVPYVFVKQVRRHIE